MNNLKPYDWASKPDSLKYIIPCDEAMCPSGHVCYRSKGEWNKYFYCNKCDDNNPDLYGKGMYWPEKEVTITFQYKDPVPGWYELDVHGSVINDGGKLISYELYREFRRQGFCAEEYLDKLGRMKLCLRNEHLESHGPRI